MQTKTLHFCECTYGKIIESHRRIKHSKFRTLVITKRGNSDRNVEI